MTITDALLLAAAAGGVRGLRLGNLRKARALFLDVVDNAVCRWPEAPSADGESSEGVDEFIGCTWLFSAAEKGEGDGEFARRRAYCVVGDMGDAGGSTTAREWCE